MIQVEIIKGFFTFAVNQLWVNSALLAFKPKIAVFLE